MLVKAGAKKKFVQIGRPLSDILNVQCEWALTTQALATRTAEKLVQKYFDS
ncbi:hypothetical protein [Pseudobacteroides cellulosolvens]|uniref:hypothetical protein n=1 Tax=Pseudobacteroides cellulosolvens TaxID=35825 RepID=UPI0012B6053B|nr:hypothetical protein [Pseudobacteroides cellulosolvens]